MEKWWEMTLRHKQERFDLVQSLANSLHTQTEAAKILDISVKNLNNFIQRNNIHWPIIQQGRKKQEILDAEDKLREAMLEDAKLIRKKVRARDGITKHMKQHMTANYNLGGREAKPETLEIIRLAREGEDKNTICRRMSVQGYSRRQTLEVLSRHSEKIVRPA